MTTANHHARSLVQWGALAVGATFLLVGVLGFVPGITTDYWLHLALGLGMITLGVLLPRLE